MRSLIDGKDLTISDPLPRDLEKLGVSVLELRSSSIVRPPTTNTGSNSEAPHLTKPADHLSDTFSDLDRQGFSAQDFSAQDSNSLKTSIAKASEAIFSLPVSTDIQAESDIVAIPGVRTLSSGGPQTQSEAPKAQTLMPYVSEPDASEVIDADVRGVRFASNRTEVVLGEGPDRLALTVSTEGQTVHVAAQSASASMVHALNQTSGELKQSLQQSGMELGDFSASHEGEQQQEGRPRDTNQEDTSSTPIQTKLLLRKRRIVA